MQSYRSRIYEHYVHLHRNALAPETLEGLAPRATTLRRLVRFFFPIQRDAQIVDLGCGLGALVYFAREAGYKNIRGVTSTRRSPAAEPCPGSKSAPARLARRASVPARTWLNFRALPDPQPRPDDPPMSDANAPLQVGQSVPDFELTTFDPTTGGFGTYSLAANKKAGKWSVLVFYPADFTFV